MTDQTSFLPLASGPQQPAYWQPPTGSVPANPGWGQPAGVWMNRPVPPGQEGSLSVPPGKLETGGRRPSDPRRTRTLVVLLAVMTVAAVTLGVLYVVGSSSAASSMAAAQAATENERDARQRAEDARNDAEDRAANAEDERDAAKSTAQDLQACQQSAKDLVAALQAPDTQASRDAATDALTRMATACQ
jgi:hypothetical protein